jgi:hypothetical protein
MSARGALLFARYAYPPNELGYCGPEGAAALLQPDATREIERRARQFDGAWAYLEVIAEEAGLADPLDAGVVEAYWLGNDLLGTVAPDVLLTRLEDRFRGQLGGTWRAAADRATPHHTFQVFEVYPWAGLLAADHNTTAVSVLDRCRIRIGRVLEVHGEEATVESSALHWDGSALGLAPARTERARWSVDGTALLDAVAPGDLVTLHWDWVCDVVTEEQAARLEALEERQRVRAGVSSGVR